MLAKNEIREVGWGRALREARARVPMGARIGECALPSGDLREPGSCSTINNISSWGRDGPAGWEKHKKLITKCNISKNQCLISICRRYSFIRCALGIHSHPNLRDILSGSQFLLAAPFIGVPHPVPGISPIGGVDDWREPRSRGKGADEILPLLFPLVFPIFSTQMDSGRTNFPSTSHVRHPYRNTDWMPAYIR